MYQEIKDTRPAEQRILNGENECYIKMTFGKDKRTAFDLHSEINCTMPQLIWGVLTLISKIGREDIMVIRDSLFEHLINTREFSKEELLEYAKKEMEKENGQDGNIQDSK